MTDDQRLTSKDVDEQKFPRGLRGYAMDEVDDFLDLIAAELDRLDRAPDDPGRVAQPLVSASDVLDKEFTGAVRGYAMGQVDDFLDRAAATLEALQREPPAPPEPAPPPLDPRELTSREFARADLGYSVHEVDRFLDLVAREIAYLQNAKAKGYTLTSYFLSPADIGQITFTHATPGYDRDEVDRFLDLLMAELARLQDTTPPPPRSSRRG